MKSYGLGKTDDQAYTATHRGAITVTSLLRLRESQGYLTESNDERMRRYEQDAVVAREKARRILIYQDMIERLGEIDFKRLSSWDWQPSDEAIDRMVAEVDDRRTNKGREKARKAAMVQQEDEGQGDDI